MANVSEEVAGELRETLFIRKRESALQQIIDDFDKVDYDTSAIHYSLERDYPTTVEALFHHYENPRINIGTIEGRKTWRTVLGYFEQRGLKNELEEVQSGLFRRDAPVLGGTINLVFEIISGAIAGLSLGFLLSVDISEPCYLWVCRNYLNKRICKRI